MEDTDFMVDADETEVGGPEAYRRIFQCKPLTPEQRAFAAWVLSGARREEKDGSE
jgi:hypothetical protein